MVRARPSSVKRARPPPPTIFTIRPSLFTSPAPARPGSFELARRSSPRTLGVVRLARSTEPCWASAAAGERAMPRASQAASTRPCSEPLSMLMARTGNGIRSASRSRTLAAASAVARRPSSSTSQRDTTSRAVNCSRPWAAGAGCRACRARRGRPAARPPSRQACGPHTAAASVDACAHPVACRLAQVARPAQPPEDPAHHRDRQADPVPAQEDAELVLAPAGIALAQAATATSWARVQVGAGDGPVSSCGPRGVSRRWRSKRSSQRYTVGREYPKWRAVRLTFAP